MAIYKVVGSYEEFYEAVIEADSANTAMQIFYQNAGHMSATDGNWVDIHIDDEFQDEEELDGYGESIEYTMKNYEPTGGKISV
jgi:hypothetical protein